MKLVRWKRFIWDLAKLPPFEVKFPEQYQFRDASRDEAKAVTSVIFTAFSLDTAWSDTLKIFRERLEAQLEQAFAREAVPALVITHGQRIIAASALCTDADAESNLISGPCVLVEYCNRGLGTALLHYTLRQLKSAGLGRAAGITKDNVAAGKFVYPKFGSVSAAHDFEPLLVGS